MYEVPRPFRSGPFHRSEALAAGITRSVLQGPQFVRVHEAVYRFRSHEMTFDDEVEAARLALPQGARTTGLTRLRQAGLSYGDPAPLRFVVQGDHHLVLRGVFLHRTVLMPPCDDVGVTPTAAFIAYCAEARMIDAIKVGSWLLHHELLDGEQLERLLAEQPWRRGCREVAMVTPHLDGRCRSLPEAEVLSLIRFSGLPEPEVNQPMDVGDGEVLTPDFWYTGYRCLVEYEGGQHQEDREQYVIDIERYSVYRRLGMPYELLTKEKLRNPRVAVGRVHRLLVGAGYDGPPPAFGAQWQMLFSPLADVVKTLARSDPAAVGGAGFPDTEPA